MSIHLSVFQKLNLFDATVDFLEQLGIRLTSTTSQKLNPQDTLDQYLKNSDLILSIDELYYVGLIDESVFQNTLFDEKDESFNKVFKRIDEKYDGILIFAVNLNMEFPSRTQLSEITRAFNRASKKLPVIVIYKYKSVNEELISFTASERLSYQQTWREGEKIGKISLLRDINLANTHSGHIKILQDLIIDQSITNFKQLYIYWRQVFDVQLLNKNFFKEISNWYFWAIKVVRFPLKNKLVDDPLNNSINVIRPEF